MPAERCGNCHFWRTAYLGEGGRQRTECRVNPPDPTYLAASSRYWPATADDEWCGRWEVNPRIRLTPPNQGPAGRK